jgi:hypothetical protein
MQSQQNGRIVNPLDGDLNGHLRAAAGIATPSSMIGRGSVVGIGEGVSVLGNGLQRHGIGRRMEEVQSRSSSEDGEEGDSSGEYGGEEGDSSDDGDNDEDDEDDEDEEDEDEDEEEDDDEDDDDDGGDDDAQERDVGRAERLRATYGGGGGDSSAAGADEALAEVRLHIDGYVC